MKKITKAEQYANKILDGQRKVTDFLESDNSGNWYLHDARWINNHKQRLLLVSRLIKPENDICTVRAVEDSKKAKRGNYLSFTDRTYTYEYTYGGVYNEGKSNRYFAAIVISLRKPSKKKQL